MDNFLTKEHFPEETDSELSLKFSDVYFRLAKDTEVRVYIVEVRFISLSSSFSISVRAR